ncbi:MAG: RNA pseudouridine synthase [Peptococcaceae bacterium]|jgi:23S rRNA pseudouridine1911/1915/1917 synthase|nr:RNA pseudouridine synthase [Peptococcaceae bacterium]
MNNEFIVKSNGQLLNIVREQLSDMPSGKVKSYLEHRLISVDGTVTSRYDYPVHAGQLIRVRRASANEQQSPLDVLYEDAELFAVNKPAGLLTVATDKEKKATALRILRDSGVTPLFVVHRLDRDTSGVLLFAKTLAIRDMLQNAWGDIIARREYAAVCEGVFTDKCGHCDTYLRETSAHVVYSVPHGNSGGKRAVTDYEVLHENAHYSYLRVLLSSGRKNQIRVHMQDLGHPVVGDKKYGATSNPLHRIGLHASVLELRHPVTELTITMSAPPDKTLRLPRARA